MNRFFLGFLISIFTLACSSPKIFRKPTKEEASAIKTYSNVINTKDGLYHILIITDEGDMVVKLYNETPLHRDNFVSKVKAGFYDSLMFHRVIKNFMIQGGDPTSKEAQPGKQLGNGSAPGDRIPAEFRTEQGIYHKRGVLAAARDGNPEKASSNCQFYIVQRPAWRASELDSAVLLRRQSNNPDFKDLTLNEDQKKIYTTVGGTPHLDGGYTVYGELEKGLDVLDKIATTKTDRADRPLSDIRMRMFILSEPKKKK
jgi:cyclophilin family peptidyl-prolyl cis-trans isomerase